MDFGPLVDVGRGLAAFGALLFLASIPNISSGLDRFTMAAVGVFAVVGGCALATIFL